MGDKTAARRAAVECGVPVVPGTNQPLSSPDEAQAFAKKHGFPVILKASMGGGGRGMRVVRTGGDGALDVCSVLSHQEPCVPVCVRERERESGRARALFGVWASFYVGRTCTSRRQIGVDPCESCILG